MGNGGYWILVWDDWGRGLVMKNPRPHTEGYDIYGNPNNWFPEETENNITDEEIAKKHQLSEYKDYMILRSER